MNTSRSAVPKNPTMSGYTPADPMLFYQNICDQCNIVTEKTQPQQKPIKPRVPQPYDKNYHIKHNYHVCFEKRAPMRCHLEPLHSDKPISNSEYTN